ncbi:MAG: hypothetical protein A2Y10_05645 [Planctomycetes bacterium GWF2_41_51]|nr:MAG: hypothetical protein A2Y10_05645 [Planctomycetes bacterium GWF2_41_51]
MLNDIQLNGVWAFAYSPNQNSVIPSEEAFISEMPVPAIWDDHKQNFANFSNLQINPDYSPPTFPMQMEFPPDASLPYLIGTGWYKKTFTLPAILNDVIATLRIGGVRLQASVWINRSFLGTHVGHSTPFEFSIESLLKPGTNEIIIAVSNHRDNVIGCDIRGYAGKSGGIYRNVSIKLTSSAQISNVYILRNSHNQLCWNLEFRVSAKCNYMIEWLIREKDSGNIIKQGSVPVEDSSSQWFSDSLELKEWSDFNPVLYDIEINLINDGKIVDTYMNHFGLRTIEVDSTHLLLNKKPLYLRGATEHCYFPLTCTPHIDFQEYKTNLIKLKQLGFNWLRFHTWVPPEEYLDAADETGMLIQVEPPAGFTASEWQAILIKCRKHPSVIIYCAGNEELIDENKIEQLSHLANVQKKLIPDAIFNPQEALRGIEYSWNELDLGSPIVNFPFKHNPTRLNKLKLFSDVLGHYSWGFLSYSSLHGKWKKLNQFMAHYKKPLLGHELGIFGSYLDLSLEDNYQNSRINTDLISGCRNYLSKQQVLTKAQLYYQNSCKWMHSLTKYVIEKARKCSYLSGYDFLGAIDHHWHRSGYACGLMNEFYQLKHSFTPEHICSFNGADVLLLDEPENRNLHTGKKYNFDVYLSNYSAESWNRSKLHWELLNNKNILASGSATIESELGTVNKISQIEFVVPLIDKPVSVVLKLTLTAQDRILSNDWNFWLFPDIPKLDTSDLIITNEINSDIINKLSEGASVLLIGPANLPTLPTSFQMAICGRPAGNIATVVYDHPIFSDFPHQGFCDWQFASLLENGCAVVFNEISLPFEPIIEVVSSYKNVFKQTCLFEFAANKGRLTVCTLNMNTDEPASKWLFSQIINHCQQSTVQPAITITLDKLKAAFLKQYSSLNQINTDKAFDPNAQL